MYKIGDQVWDTARCKRAKVIDIKNEIYYIVEYPTPINGQFLSEPIFEAVESQLRMYTPNCIPKSKIENSLYPEYVRCPLLDLDLLAASSCVLCSDIAGGLIKDRDINPLFTQIENWKGVCQNCRWFRN